jgi:hypothetical protein
MTQVNYPPNVPYREPRPRRDQKSGAALLGALAGLALTRHPVGALAGGFFGHSATNDEPLPLTVALQQEFERAGCKMIEFYRQGPYVAEVLFDYGGGFWTLRSQAPQTEGWNVENLEDWLFGDLIYFQLPQKLQSIQKARWNVA